MHKLSSPWEGPFIVSRLLGNGAYYLIDAQEPRKNKADNSDKETKRPWNVNLLVTASSEKNTSCMFCILRYSLDRQSVPGTEPQPASLKMIELPPAG
jgi:hypothetical protein